LGTWTGWCVEGNDPNTLRTPPPTLISLHVEDAVSARLTAVLDVANLLGVCSPTQLLGNPYLIGPPGYAGGDPLYAAASQRRRGSPSPMRWETVSPRTTASTPHCRGPMAARDTCRNPTRWRASSSSACGTGS